MMTPHQLDQWRRLTPPSDTVRLDALDKAEALSDRPGYTRDDVWEELNDDERTALADLFGVPTLPTWSEDEGSCDGEGW